MLRYVFRNWWHHKERFILILVGALVISAGLSYLVGLAHTNKGTVIENLQKQWKASYDIVVRPPGARTMTEKKGLLNPNYLSGISGGISLKQYQTIKKIDGISVAAPIAIIGNAPITVKQDIPEPKKNGIYRFTYKKVLNNGYRKISNKRIVYYVKGPWRPNTMKPGSVFGASLWLGDLEDPVYFTRQLLAGIDPTQEQKLVGLDRALVKNKNSRYFKKSDSVVKAMQLDNPTITLPILLSTQPFAHKAYITDIERLDVNFPDKANAENKFMKAVKEKGGKAYLDKIKGIEYRKVTKHSQDVYKEIFQSLLHPKKKENNKNYKVQSRSHVGFEATHLSLHKTASPFQQQWPFAYVAQPVPSDRKFFGAQHAFRKVKFYDVNSKKKGIQVAILHMNIIGAYHPESLKLSKDPLTELPMETYRPATARLVLTQKGEPVNPPVKILPTGNPLGFLTKPPTMLTTLQAAAAIKGDKPISAIRIKVAGVNQMNDKNENKLKRIAKDIRDKTGLITDITLGSSPQPALMYIPENGKVSALGWIEQPWVRLGSSYTIFKQAKLGFAGIIAAVMLVAVIYVFTTNLVSLLARRKEYALLLAVGWRPMQLVKMIFLESVLLGLFVAVAAWIVEAIAITNGTHISGVRIWLVGVIGLAVYLFGAIWPARSAARISPYETMKTGEIRKSAKRFIQSKSVFTMAINQMVGKFQRSLLSIFAIAVPTTLLIFFIFITFQLKGVLYTSLLGKYVAVQIGPVHYIAMGIAFLIAVLTTSQLIWQNVTERRAELALLKALGWKNRTVRRQILYEGLFSGLLAGIVGIGLALILITVMYQSFPTQYLGILIVPVVIPIAIGLLSSLLPAEMAVRILPMQGMNDRK